MADICNDIPGYAVLSKVFPLAHPHRFRDLMKMKVKRHIESTIPLSEMETSNMVRILLVNQKRYLELLSEKLEGEDKATYTNALFDIRSESVSLTRFQEAETQVWEVVNKYGKLLLIGDQLTVNLYIMYIQE